MNERAARYLFISLAVFASAALIILFLFDPAIHGFYPQCMLHKITGLYCPGCGALRATHQLLHGNIAKAFSLNPLFVIGTPLALSYAVLCRVRKRSGVKVNQLADLVWLSAGVCAVITFAILRNLPYASFAWMRP